jgi:hypothetical protein
MWLCSNYIDLLNIIFNDILGSNKQLLTLKSPRCFLMWWKTIIPQIPMIGLLTSTIFWIHSFHVINHNFQVHIFNTIVGANQPMCSDVFYIHCASEGLVLWYPSLALCLSLNWINIYWTPSWWMPVVLCIHSFGCNLMFIFFSLHSQASNIIIVELEEGKTLVVVSYKTLNANFLNL